MNTSRMVSVMSFAAAALLLAGTTAAAPSISSTSGTFTHGNSVTIGGSGFGSKSTAAPVKYDDFDDGEVGSDLSGWSLVKSSGGVYPKYSDTRSHNGDQSGLASFENQYNCSAYLGNLDLTTVYASYWVYWEKVSGDDTRNMKLARFTAAYGNYKDGNPKMGYTGLNGSSGTWYLNNGDGYDMNWGNYVVGGTWHRIEMYFVASSSPGQADGTWAFWKNCSQIVDEKDYVTIATTADRNFVRNFILPFYCAHDPGGPHRVYYDDVYLDSTQARVEIGNASTWSGCSHKEIQVPTAWSSSSITVDVNKGSMSDGTAYLYVVDSSGGVNSSGYQITLGTASTYSLTVNSGSGDGNYTEDTIVNVSADSPASGKMFDEWIGDTDNIDDVYDSDTTITMPASDAEITATYTDATLYALTVNSGSGDGSYQEDWVVDISADAAPSGQSFDKWAGDTSGIADVGSASTTFTMPASAAEITATYASLTLYTLTVNSGTGDGDYAASTVVDVSADSPASGKQFDQWTGQTTGIADVEDPTTTITMPASDAEITATYEDTSAGTTYLIVNWGDSESNNVYDFSDWDEPFLGLYTSYSSLGPDGLKAGWTGTGLQGSVSGSSESFSEGDQIRVTWYNSKTSSLTFTPKISFDDDDYYTSGTSGTWYDMTELQCAAESSGTTTYTFTSSTEGSYTLVNVTRYTNGANEMVIDKIELITAGGGSPPQYTLTVNSGTGDGDYQAGTVVNIAADAAPSGQEFDEWTGDTTNVASVTAASTTITMPASEAEITATYTDKTWTLTVNSGSGDGDYVVGTVVDIDADTAPSGKQFSQWTGDTAGIASVTSSSTTLTMPYADAEITATYADVTYTLTVNSGTGDGDYGQGAVVDIDADTAASGEFFDAWTGETSNIADVNDGSTTITMPAANTEVTATYTSVASGLVSRYTFDIDARDTYGTNDGTLTNGASVTTDGTRGKVLSLDGTDDYVDLPSANMAAGRSELTLSLWIKPDELVNSDAIYDEYAETEYWQFSINVAEWYTRDSSTGTTGSRNNDLLLPTLTTGQWQHLAFVYSVTNSIKAVYVDGLLAASDSTSIDALTSDRDGVRIGYPSDGTYYDGLIDDVRLYSRALNSTEIAYLAEQTLYTLTVNSGTGDGDYIEDEVVDIAADSPPSGQIFDVWIGDTAGIADVNSGSTSYTMPAASAEITATYTDETWTLTVNSGTGDGDYVVATVVDIAADSAPSGQEFDAWIGDTSGIADVEDPTTTLTMPYADAEITATYTDSGPTTTLIVNWGSSAANNVLDFSDWDNVYLGPYTSYSSAGPDGIAGGTSLKYHVMGVNGSSESFSSGDKIIVTWYNNTGDSQTFTPMISFDDEDYYDGGSSSGTWYDMTEITVDDGQSDTATYTFDSSSAGSYSRVHVCRGIMNEGQLICDKIELER